MLRHETKPLFHIYPYLDAGEYRNTLLGSVVKYPDIPTEGYAPYKAGKQPRQIIPGLDPTPIQVKNIKFLTHKIQDSDISSSLDDYLTGFFQNPNSVVRTAARLWHMESAAENLQKLLQKRTYTRQLIKLLQNSHNQEGYFVTDIVTLFDAAEDTYRSPATMAQLTIDVSARQPRTTGQCHVQTAEHCPVYYGGETIVFLGYRRVRLEKSDGIIAKLARLFLGQGQGLRVTDKSDYWPDTIGRPAKSSVETPLDDSGDSNEAGDSLPRPNAYIKIARELGFDVEVVG
ncbi:hypothetical protein JDV02_003142 [Purpureocillium takamizusanense]|uniref:Uncharacterized protein n=1 Tax=Purpureocillium takamizusanense TaxID=2060973 RepID=A0A9Q8V9I9_9HYPO|nr:uncharacterized protein JDV02_003142 [Purpureocillium takamizusanense]UNI16731.1 hypothetical protein JDV02_003142 [Purpureocillium takamizusanense]